MNGSAVGRRSGPVRSLIAAVAPIAIVAVVVGGCAGPAAAADVARSDATQAPGTAVAAAQAASAVDAFGFDVLHASTGGNTVFSPASIALALAMARGGAVGETAAQMDKVLHDLYSAGGGSGIVSLDQALNALSGSFQDAYGSRQTIELHVTNAPFGQKNEAFEQAYLDYLAANFDAGLRLTDFAADPEGARKTINAWVSDQTNGRIPSLLDKLDALTRLVLVNAVYMKAAWHDPFQPAATSDAPFTLPDGSQVQLPTMHQTLEPGLYASGSGWQAVELPYGNGPLAMDVILPDNLGAFEASLSGSTFGDIASSFHSAAVSLSLPRFKTESKTELSGVLGSLGMTLALDPDRADFSGMTRQERLFISAVVHQANISVDEKGTEASAATAVMMEATGMPVSMVTLNVDRPFVFAVRDTRSGAILFLGRIDDPSK